MLTSICALGERVGLVGENGTGKTTLFRIIMNTESSDSGKIVFRKGAQAATLEQELNAYDGSVLERVISGNPFFASYSSKNGRLGKTNVL